MDENKKIYSDKALIGFAVLIGPFAFLYGAIKNSRFTKDKKRRKAQVVLAFLPIILFIISVLLLSDYSISIAWLWTGLAIYLIQKYFKPDIDIYREKGYKYLNGLKSGILLGLASIFMVVSYLGFFYIYFKSSVPTVSVVDYLRVAFIPNSFDINLYDKLSTEYSDNEIADQAMLNEISAASGDRLLVLAKENHKLWIRNAEISKEILAIDNLPSSFAKYEELLSSYSQYRREEAGLLIENINNPNEENYENLWLMRSRSEEVKLEIERLR